MKKLIILLLFAQSALCEEAQPNNNFWAGLINELANPGGNQQVIIRDSDGNATRVYKNNDRQAVIINDRTGQQTRCMQTYENNYRCW